MPLQYTYVFSTSNQTKPKIADLHIHPTDKRIQGSQRNHKQIKGFLALNQKHNFSSCLAAQLLKYGNNPTKTFYMLLKQHHPKYICKAVKQITSFNYEVNLSKTTKSFKISLNNQDTQTSIDTQNSKLVRKTQSCNFEFGCCSLCLQLFIQRENLHAPKSKQQDAKHESDDLPDNKNREIGGSSRRFVEGESNHCSLCVQFPNERFDFYIYLADFIFYGSLFKKF